MKYALLILFTLLATSVRSDVLFVDLNNSPTEVEAAERAAEMRGEKLIVFPELSDETLHQLKAARAMVTGAQIIERKRCRDFASDSCADAKTKTADTKKNLDAVYAGIPKMKAAQFSAELTNLRANNVSLSSVIISGHHTDREFWGINASLSEEDIEHAFTQNKPLGDGVRSLYLWACYGATTDDFIKNWKSGFPNTSMLAGFDGQAPSSVRKSSSALLEDLMEKEKLFENAHDKDEVKDMFNQLDEINHVSAQLCLNRETVVSRKGARTIEEDVEACGHNSRDEVKYTNLYNCYLNAEPGCEVLPDTENETNPLRGAYDYFQETRHCDERMGAGGEPREANQAQVRRLLYDTQIRYTFSQVAAPQLKRLNALMDALGLPKSLHLEQMWGLSRKEYVDKIIAMKTAYIALADRAKDNNGHIRDVGVLAFGYNIAELDKFNDGECAPLEWLEEDAHATDSKCGIVKGMDAAMANAKALVASYGQEN